MTGSIFDRNGLEILERDECLRLLAGSSGVGRIGLTSGALPVILPVNFALDGDDVVLRTRPGTMLAAATNGVVVAFEVDETDAAHGTGWSVLARGVARAVPCGEETNRLDPLPLPRWAAGEDAHYVRISTEIISGRRLAPRLALAEDRPVQQPA